MKICYLANNAIPSTVASAIQIVKMCEALSKNDNEVSLICPNSNKIKKNVFNFYNVKTKFNIEKLNSFKKFPLGYKYYIFSIISVIRSLKYKPQIYITRNFFTAFVLILFRKKVIFEIHHDIQIESRITKFLIKFFKVLNNKNIIRIIAISKKVKIHYLETFNLNKNKIIVLPSGSSIKTYSNFENNYSKKLNVGYFGSIYKSRGADIFLNLSKIDKKNNYFMFGDYSKYKNLNFKYSNKNLFLGGYVSYNKIPKLLKKMDIFLMPYSKKVTSGGDVGDISKFTSPLKLFDYLSIGKVILSSKLPVLQEVITENKNVIFIKNYENIYSWKLEIDKICKNLSKRLIISKNNYNLGKSFNLKNRAKKYLENL